MREQARRLAAAVEGVANGSSMLPGLFALAVLAMLYVARALILPVVMAVVLHLVFAPLVRKLKRLHLPQALSAAVIVIGLVAIVAGGTYYLATPATEWLAKAPAGIREIGHKLRPISGPVKNINTAQEEVTAVTDEMTAGRSGGRVTREIAVKPRTLASTVASAAQALALSVVSMFALLYFLLASGDLFMHKVIAAIPRFSDKQRARDLLRRIESEVSTYLLTVTVINACLGAAVALVMHLLGVANPVLWGAMTGIFNFVPYLGDLASFAVLSVVGLLTFDKLWLCLLVPGSFYLLTVLEGYVITPLVVGRRLQLNAVIVVLSVLFWGWMWGVVGAILAVPILVVLRAVCVHVEALQFLVSFIED